jgi:predicted nuclease of predicted toxin-antitoxin system
MRFLIDASMPRSTTALLVRLGHEAVDVRDIMSGSTPDPDVAHHAKTNGLALLTRDFDFSDIRNYPPEQYAGIVVVELPDDATAANVLQVLESFLTQPDLVKHLPGHLAIVSLSRVRFRPA